MIFLVKVKIVMQKSFPLIVNQITITIYAKISTISASLCLWNKAVGLHFKTQDMMHINHYDVTCCVSDIVITRRLHWTGQLLTVGASC